MDFDMRIPHGLSTEEVLSLVKDKLSKYNGEVDVSKIAGEDPSYTSPNSLLIKAIESSVSNEINITPAATLIQGATDARHFRMVGSEAIIYGPAEWGGIHGYNERIKVKDLVTASRIYLRTIYEMLK
jgi:acetylornithine deacetylase/succinyl-diaminopimelate desuccinylase-like protein